MCIFRVSKFATSLKFAFQIEVIFITIDAATNQVNCVEPLLSQ